MPLHRLHPSCILIRLSRRRFVRPHGQPVKDGEHLCHVRAHEIGSRPKLEGIAPISATCVREPSARRMLLALPKASVPKALERLKHVLETALLRVVEPPIAAPNEFKFEHRDAPACEQCTRALEHEGVLSFRVHAEQVDRLPWPQLRGRKGVERRACDLPVETRLSVSVEARSSVSVEARPSVSVEARPSVSVEAKDISAKSKDISAKSKDISAKAKDISAKAKDISAKAKVISAKSKVISAKSKALRGIQKVLSVSGHQRQSEAIRGNQRQTKALRGAQWDSTWRG